MMEGKNEETSGDEYFNVLVKPVSADCNLKCTYCFYRRPTDPYQSKTTHRMPEVVLRNLIAQQMSSAGDYVSFGWQGGEPLLAGIKFFYRVVYYQRLFGYSGQKVANTIQTNGTLIDEEWAWLFHVYNFLIGISVDGPPELHNKYRRTSMNKGTFNHVMRGIDILRKYEVPFDILMVLNDITVKEPESIYEFLLKNKFTHIHFIPCVTTDPETGKVTDFSITPDEYGDFLSRFFDLWYNHGQPYLSVRFFNNILAILLGLKPDLCLLKERCGKYLVVEYNGDIYPCDFFVEKNWKLGNLMEEPIENIIRSKRLMEFAMLKKELDDGCKTCRWLSFCYGGCPKMRLKENTFYLCNAYRRFFRYTEDRFKELRELYTKEDA